jgi:putative addiction module killer protein
MMEKQLDLRDGDDCSIMRVQAYAREDGSVPFEEWLKELDSAASAKVIIAQTRLMLGNTSNVKWFDGIGEYRINWGPGYRIYLAQDGPELILLYAGGTKQGQQSDIAFALVLHEEYQKRKKQVIQNQVSEKQAGTKPIDVKKRRKKR